MNWVRKMSQTLEEREVTNDDVVELVEKALKEGREEAIYILTLTLSRRREGCGYMYLHEESLEIIEGNVDVVTLSRSEFNCDVEERVAIIPRFVPTVVKKTYKDEDPEVDNYVCYYVFDGKGWKSIKVSLPKF